MDRLQARECPAREKRWLNEMLPCAVADAKPNQLRRMAVKQAALVEIGIFGDNDEAVHTRIFPNIFVRLSEQPAFAHMDAAGKKRRPQAGQLRREVLVKEQ